MHEKIISVTCWRNPRDIIKSVHKLKDPLSDTCICEMSVGTTVIFIPG